MSGLETLAMVASVAGSVVSTIGQMQASSYQQAVAERNAKIADDNRRRAIEDAQRENQDWGDSARLELGQLMAGLSASGVSTAGGTSTLLESSTRKLLGRDSERIRQEGTERARAFGQQSADFQSQASQAGRKKTFSLFGGALDATSTYISSATATKRRKSLLD